MVTRNSANTYIVPTTANEVTAPAQPAFSAYLGTSDLNVTGNNTVFYLGDTDVGTALTSIFDQNGDFTLGASGGAYFTAPVTGKYYFDVKVQLGGLVAACNLLILDLVATSRTQRLIGSNPYTFGYNGELTVCGSCFVNMSATDTVKVRCAAYNSGGDVVDVLLNNTIFSGYLIC